jgi:hypothetical protein
VRSTFSGSSVVTRATFLPGSRAWLFERYRQWKTDTASRVFWITGKAGSGKSMFSRELLSRHQQDVVGHFFFQHNSQMHNDVADMSKTLGYQLACRGFSDSRTLEAAVRDLEQKPASELTHEVLFEYYLEKPLAALSRQNTTDGKAIILLDALDEAKLSQRKSAVSFLLAQRMDRLLPQVCFVLTSRPEDLILEDFEAHEPLAIDTDSKENAADLELFIRDKISTCLAPGVDKVEAEQKLLQKCNGLFLYASKILEANSGQRLTLQAIDACPKEMSEFYRLQLERCQRQDEKQFFQRVVPLLEVVDSAHEPLSVAELASVLNQQEDEVWDVVNLLGSLLDVDESSEPEQVRFCHKSVSDFVRSADSSRGRGHSAPDGSGGGSKRRQARKKREFKETGLTIDLQRGHKVLAWACVQELLDKGPAPAARDAKATRGALVAAGGEDPGFQEPLGWLRRPVCGQAPGTVPRAAAVAGNAPLQPAVRRAENRDHGRV